MRRILLGVRPACFGMVVGVVISLTLSNYFPDFSVNLPALVIGAVDLALLLKFKAGIPTILLFSAGMGLVLFGMLGLPAGI